MTVIAMPAPRHGKPFRAYQQHQWSEALRSLRDCGVIRADNTSAERYRALHLMGLAEEYWNPARPEWRLFRLTKLGHLQVAELFPSLPPVKIRRQG